MPQTIAKSKPDAAKKMISSQQRQDVSSVCNQTRVLLALWDLGGADYQVKKGDLTKRLVRKTEKSSDYQLLYDQLQQEGAIEIDHNKISLSARGIERLGEGLSHPDFMFDASIGAKTANALLRWFRQNQNSGVLSTANGKTATTIESYDAFKMVVLEVYDRLNRDFNMDNLVPIYRIRREIGDRVSRSEFDEWLLEMQSEDIWQLIGGEMPEITPDKAEDSVRTALGGVRFYAKHL